MLGREPVLVDELANMKQKRVNAVVAMELDAPEVLCAKLDVGDRSQPPKQIIHTSPSVRIKFLGSIESPECRLEDAVGQRVIFEFIPFTGGATLAEEIAPQCVGDQQLAAHTRNFFLVRQIAAVETPPNQAACTFDQHSGKQIQELSGIQRAGVGQRVLFLQSVPGVAKKVINVVDGDPTDIRINGANSPHPLIHCEKRGQTASLSLCQQIRHESFDLLSGVKVFLEQRLNLSGNDFTVPGLVC